MNRINVKTLRQSQLFWAYFIGAGALCGSLMMFIDPSGKMFGMDPLLPILRHALPPFEFLFDNFIASGVTLLIVNGLTNMVSASLIHRHHRLDIAGSIACGMILLLWILFEFYIWGFHFASFVYLIFSILQIANGCFWRRRRDMATL